MMDKHTPGPWNLVWWGNEKYPFPLSILADNDGAWITRDGVVSSEANARLIAAAPDLLEALESVYTQLRMPCVDTKALERKVEVAIAKAKGIEHNAVPEVGP